MCSESHARLASNHASALPDDTSPTDTRRRDRREVQRRKASMLAGQGAQSILQQAGGHRPGHSTSDRADSGSHASGSHASGGHASGGHASHATGSGASMLEGSGHGDGMGPGRPFSAPGGAKGRQDGGEGSRRPATAAEGLLAANGGRASPLGQRPAGEWWEQGL